jgi:hypothetical protein
MSLPAALLLFLLLHSAASLLIPMRQLVIRCLDGAGAEWVEWMAEEQQQAAAAAAAVCLRPWRLAAVVAAVASSTLTTVWG